MLLLLVKYCVVSWPWILCSSLLNHSFFLLLLLLTTGLFPWLHTPLQLPLCPPPIYRRIIYTSSSYSILLLVLLPFSVMRIIVIFPQWVHWSALSSHLTGPLIALAHGEALLIGAFSSLLAGPSLSASPSPSLVTLSFSDIFCDFSIILDTTIWGCPQGSWLSSLSTLLPSEIIQAYGFTYCLYFIGSEMFTSDLCPELQTFLSTHLYTIAKTKLSIPTPEFVLPRVLPSQVSLWFSGVQVPNLEPVLTLFCLSLPTSNPPANAFTQYF